MPPVKIQLLMFLGYSPSPSDSTRAGGEPRGAHLVRDGDGCLGDGGDDEESDGNNDEVGLLSGAFLSSTEVPSTKEKRKRIRKRKKNKNKSKAKALAVQSSPPRVPLSDLFPAGDYPEGELQSYKPTLRVTARKTIAEACNECRGYWEDEVFLQQYRKAAEVHRQARKWVWETVKPGHSLKDITVGIEDNVRALLDNAGLEPGDNLKSGMGFPTGICLNHQVAHYTTNPGQKDIVLQQQDVMTVDFGVHINGWIVDSAFTMAFDPTYDNLLAAVRDATDTGIKVCISRFRVKTETKS